MLRQVTIRIAAHGAGREISWQLLDSDSNVLGDGPTTAPLYLGVMPTSVRDQPSALSSSATLMMTSLWTLRLCAAGADVRSERPCVRPERPEPGRN